MTTQNQTNTVKEQITKTPVRQIGGGWPLGDPLIEYVDQEPPVGLTDDTIFSRLQRRLAPDSSRGSIKFNGLEELGNTLSIARNFIVETASGMAKETPEDVVDLITSDFLGKEEKQLTPEEREDQERNVTVVEWNRGLENSQNQAKSQRVRELEKDTARITEGEVTIGEVSQLVGKRVAELGIEHPMVIWTKRQEDIKMTKKAKEEQGAVQVRSTAVDTFMNKNLASENDQSNVLKAVG